MMGSTANNSLRHERKFVLDNSYLDSLEFLLADLRIYQQYPQRQVNSLYFDTPTLSFYQQTLNGDHSRLKVRLRWYGDLERSGGEAQLELKTKLGELGDKKISNIKNLKYKFGQNKKTFLNYLNSNSALQNYLLEPTVTTSYLRNYYISFDNKIRFTIDSEFNTYTHVSGQIISNKNTQHLDTIYELKYHPNHEQQARELIASLPLQLSRFSKYESGVNSE